ncbi:hypothetical protein P7C71_g2950, partial [Lecanoromycetidae sp. Uapishka_2]
MAGTGRSVRSAFIHSAPPSRKSSNKSFKVISGVEKLEEENWNWYNLGRFYPVRIGQVFQSRYQVLGKLGYETTSTAWLCRDLTVHQYVTLKVCALNPPTARRELAAYNYLDPVTTSNPGCYLIRELLDSFKTTGPADLHASNVHLKIEEDSILKEYEMAELRTPSARKLDGDRVVYESRGLRFTKNAGRPMLCDFGEARSGEETCTDNIQPFVYRAPEIILHIPWTYSVDIWNIAVMVWNMFENKDLFNAEDGNGKRSNLHHMAEMVALLGPPRLDYLQRTETSWDYFNHNGNWKGAADIPDISLENFEEQLSGENKALFLDFIRKMLYWIPEERQTANQLLSHSWLRG